MLLPLVSSEAPTPTLAPVAAPERPLIRPPIAAALAGLGDTPVYKGPARHCCGIDLD